MSKNAKLKPPRARSTDGRATGGKPDRGTTPALRSGVDAVLSRGPPSRPNGGHKVFTPLSMSQWRRMTRAQQRQWLERNIVMDPDEYALTLMDQIEGSKR